ncbi:MAG: hypothetical protein EKK40_17225 [Bradyrhizobiaceae bacterium]|nr:MAG: hypothetical protein EKK40_17225 [Bradyrhizobiaceae bacterium]
MNFSFDPRAIFGFADTVRDFLPWQWRPYFSNSLVWAIILFSVALLLTGIHFLTREKPKIAWTFQTTGFPVILEWQGDGEKLSFFVEGLNLGGENISGHTLNQVDAT